MKLHGLFLLFLVAVVSFSVIALPVNAGSASVCAESVEEGESSFVVSHETINSKKPHELSCRHVFSEMIDSAEQFVSAIEHPPK